MKVKTMEQTLEILQAPTPPEDIKFLPRDIRQSGESRTDGTALALPHIDARFTQARLDEACGPFGWQSRVVDVAGRLCVGIGILEVETQEWIWKWDSGDEGGNDRGGTKALVSGGIKRAGYQWGVGRDSYDFQVRRLKCRIYVATHQGKTKIKFRFWTEDPKNAKRGFDEPPEGEGDNGNGAPEGHKGQEEQKTKAEAKPQERTPQEARRLVFDFAIEKVEMNAQEAQEWIVKREGKGEELSKTVNAYRMMYAELQEIKKANEPPEPLPTPPDPSTEHGGTK